MASVPSTLDSLEPTALTSVLEDNLGLLMGLLLGLTAYCGVCGGRGHGRHPGHHQGLPLHWSSP